MSFIPSASGNLVYIGTLFGQVLLWDAAAKSFSMSFTAFPLTSRMGVASIAINPVRDLIATSASLSNPTQRVPDIVRIWNANSGEFVRSFRVSADKCAKVSWSPDGSRLAAACSDQTLRVWRIASTEEMPEITLKFSGYSNDARFGPDGRLAAAAGNDVVILK